MKDLKIYYWEKTGYHDGASFAIAESLQEAKELIIKEFKTNYLKDHFNMSLSEQEIVQKNEYENEEARRKYSERMDNQVNWKPN